MTADKKLLMTRRHFFGAGATGLGTAALGTLLAGAVDAMPYGASLTFFDPYIVYGQRTFMETCWLPALDSVGIHGDGR